MKFQVTITYFKESGKYYDEVKTEIDDGIQTKNYTPVTAYMQGIVEKVEQMQENAQLPGLSGGKWEHHILVTCEQGYPCLILSKRPSKIEAQTKRDLRAITEKMGSLVNELSDIVE